MDPHGTTNLELRDYLRILRRQKWLVIAATVVVVVLAVGMTQVQTPTYEASSEVVLQPLGSEVLFDPSTGQRRDPARNVQTEIQIIESQPVADKVRRHLPDAPRVTARPRGQTDVVVLRVASPDPGLAADAANAYADAYIEHRRDQAVNDLVQASLTVEQRLAELRSQLPTAPGSERSALEQAQTALERTRQDLIVGARLKTGGAQVVNRAAIPTEPFRPQPVRTGGVSLVVGLMLGLGLAFLRDYLDDSVRTEEELLRAVPGVPVLGHIPLVANWRERERPQVVSIEAPTSPAAEAYRTLRTAVQFLGLDNPCQVIQVTSPSAQEGKTTTVANLGVALARAGHQVVMIGCDLRRPRLHKYFEVAPDIGYTSVLLGESPLTVALQPVDGVERLSVLASGPLPPNPSELLASRRAAELLEPLRADGRIVLIDSPPVLPVTDSLIISRWVDATLIVCSASETSRKAVSRSVEMLRQVNAPVAGLVLNGVTAKSEYGYQYYYSGSYENVPLEASSPEKASANGSRHRVTRRKHASVPDAGSPA